MNTVTDLQRTAEWFAARTGKATASRFKDVLARLKSGAPAAARQSYLIELVTERLTGSAASHFTNAAMQWGTDNEAGARVLYEQRTHVQVQETGFVAHPIIAAGASPDGLVDWDGLIEIKCPFNSAIHVQTLMDGMPDDHMPQVQGQMWITEKQWVDFVSFDPRMPEPLQLYVQRVNRDDAYIARLESEVANFLEEVDAMVATLKTKTQQ